MYTCIRYPKQGLFLLTTIATFSAITIIIVANHQMSTIGQVVTVNVMTQCLMVTAMEHVQFTILRILIVNVSAIVNAVPLLC